MHTTPTALPDLRPMTIPDLIDNVFRLYRNNFLTFVGIVALLWMPMLLLQLLLTLLFGEGFFRDLQDLTFLLETFDPTTQSLAELPLDGITAFLGLTLLVSLIHGLFLQPIMNGALIHAIHQRLLQQPVSITSAYGFGQSRILSLIAMSMLLWLAVVVLYVIPIGLFAVGFINAQSGGGVLLLLGFCLLALFVLVLLAGSLLFVFVYQIIVIEGTGPWGAIRRSWSLVRSAFGRVLLILFFSWLILAAITFVPSMSSQVATQMLALIMPSPVLAQSIQYTVNYIVQILVLPLNLMVLTLAYYDVRARKEGSDLAQRVQQAYEPQGEATP